MLQFTHLRLSGFKSFVDKTQLEIGHGLNGIVGPNGCGKSNLVEALRWVMGEGSAKQLRGGGMDDVIFAGSAKRPARNLAEVSLLLDNSARTASPAFNNSDDIEIVRRIERDKGSNYKINGKNVRARDVQMLLADTVTGANSPALVSQGRVTRIINSKPLERRLILEESAGISGLFARRHEAELRLRAADKNLERMEDIIRSQETQLSSLKRQARQATKYRNISAQIRQFDLALAYLGWKALDEKAKSARSDFQLFENEVAQHLATVTQLTKTQNAQAENLPDLRKKEAEYAANLQSKKIALSRIEEEAQRYRDALDETKTQLQQAKHDQAHESSSLEDARHSLEQLSAEQQTLLEQEKGEDGKLDEQDQIRLTLEQKVESLESEYTSLMQSEAESRANKNSLETKIQQNEERVKVLSYRIRQTKTSLETKEREKPEESLTKEKRLKIKNLEEKIQSTSKEYETLLSDITIQNENYEDAKQTLSSLTEQAHVIQAEISILKSFFDDDRNQDIDSVRAIDLMRAESGFEKALSRALGDSLNASTDENDSAFWKKIKDKKSITQDLPNGAEPLTKHIKAPALFDQSLMQIGVVQSAEDGNTIRDALLPGQSLVSQDGHYWRWDGYCQAPDATDRNAQLLEHKNKLQILETQEKEIQQQIKAQEALFEQAEEKLNTLKAQDLNKQEETTQLKNSLFELQKETEKLELQLSQAETDIMRLRETLALQSGDLEDAEKILQDDQAALTLCINAQNDDSANKRERVHQSLIEARDTHQEALRSFERLKQQQSTRKARLQAIADELVNLKNRSIRSTERLKTITERESELNQRLSSLDAQPNNFDEQKDSLLEMVSSLEKERDQAADALARVETEVKETADAQRQAEKILGQSRESRAATQALLSNVQEQLQHAEQDIQEKYEMGPTHLLTHITIDIEDNNATIEFHKNARENLVRERAAIGAVNLRADTECQDIEKELTNLLNERHDLTSAIEELRGGIHKINKEARERLSIAFEHVNAHFKDLFSQLFQGGKAHLALVDSDDPLESGLEIFAQPPGKSLQSLSLLSGGEQTLTSIALIFAMFLTNPSPICVLDEIDAPLDDANVDRLCNLLEEIAERGDTRFLIVTHHRMTMARMDRLYGVTMAEKGVSQLVSVDLQQSFQFLDKAA